MPEIDDLLTDDAQHDITVSTPSLDDALRRARRSTRRRVARVSAVTCGALALSGGLLYGAIGDKTGPGPAPRVKLAGYDTVLGVDPTDDSQILVIGPDDEHTATCTKIDGARVTLTRRAGKTVGYTADIPAREGHAP